MSRTIQPGEGIGDFVQLRESLYLVLNRFKRSEAINIVYSEKDYLGTPITVQLKALGINLVFQKDQLVLIEINRFDTIHYAYNGIGLTNLMNLKVIYNKVFGPTYPGKLINDSYLLSYPGVAFKFSTKDANADDTLTPEKLLSVLLTSNKEVPCTSIFIFNDKSFGEFMSSLGSSQPVSSSPLSSASSLRSTITPHFETGFSLLFNVKMKYIKLRLHGKEFNVFIGKTSQQDILNFLGPPDDFFNKFDSRLLIHNSFFKQITSNEANRIYKFHNYFKYGVDFLYDLNNGGLLKKIILHNGNLIESNSFVHWNKCKYEIFLGHDSSAKNPFDAYDVRITSDMYFSQIPAEFFGGSDKTPIVLNRNESELLDNDLDVISLDEVNHNWGATKLYCSKNCIWEVLNNDCISCVTIY